MQGVLVVVCSIGAETRTEQMEVEGEFCILLYIIVLRCDGFDGRSAWTFGLTP